MHAVLVDYVADVVQNAVEAGATRIALDFCTGPDEVSVTVEDNGKGMDAAQVQRARDPFYSETGKHSRRRVGLGLPLLVQAAEATGGTVTVASQPGRGTTVRFTFGARHVDAPPTGDLPGCLLGLMTFPGDYELAVRRRTPADEYRVARSELSEALGELTSVASLTLARDYLRSLESELKTTHVTEATSARPGPSGTPPGRRTE